MPRIPRIFLPGHPLHVIQRGHNRSQVFFDQDDAKAYLGWLAEGAARYGVAVHAYVLMTNHVHLLVSPDTAQSLPMCMRHVNWRFSIRSNDVRERTGALWEGRYKACVIDADDYFLACSRYIEMNPVRAGLAKDPGAYRWSSYRANAEGKTDPLLTPHPLYEAVGTEGYRALCAEALGADTLKSIRDAVNGGAALGSPGFVARMSRHAGRTLAVRRRGRPKIK
ncbi:MAG: transposase [Rhodospirillaceae bacterium]|nr:transposase [Rhodospirillaceae bacterium]